MSILSLLFVFILCSSPSPLDGFRIELPEFIQGGAKVEIESEEVVWQAKNGGVLFKGNVRLKQGDFLLTCTQLTVVSGPQGGISRVEASGEVELKRETWRAKAQRAVFEIERSNLTLTGQPEMLREGQVLRGREIVIDMKNDTVRAVGAKAVFHLEDLKKTSKK